MLDRITLRRHLEQGLPILIYDFDGREEETDMVFYGEKVTWKVINTLRTQAGGLICYVTSKDIGQQIGITFISEIIKNNYPKLYKRPKYGDEPAFSLWVNHIDTKTGISDEDRAKTIRELHTVIELIENNNIDEAIQKFYNEFYSPGHVPILLSRGLSTRKGHTELTMALFSYLGLKKSAIIAEMLDNNISLSKEKSLIYSRNNGFPLIDGKEIIKEVVGL
ncbi:3,4-dihydroxy-2-butanone 4-phosphate synthase [Sulfolobus acidocaldarius SUSAZ]|nr:3,4-dihydroxy-2-butanone 4-phosphate synthase [Sulfolobus acidocaldarius SUSAZ]